MEISGSSFKKFIFSQKKSFLIFQETKLSGISGNGNPEKTSYIFLNKKGFVIFGETETPKNNSLYIRKKV